VAYDLAWKYRQRDVVVSGGGIYGSNGAAIWGGTRDFVAALRAATSSVRTRRDQEQFLLVADGFEGQMHVVESFPIPVLHAIPIYQGTVIVRMIEHIVTGTGMYVKPKTQSDGTVLVALTPVVSYREGTTRLIELAVTVRVRPGEPIALLAHEEAQQSFGGSFFSVRSSLGMRRILQVLTIERGP